MSLKPIVYALTGPTAVGKTAWALRWAERCGAEILSCDSLLFYRGMDIGTAKPTAAERARVPHHLIDICDVAERMDIVDYVRRAQRALGEMLARGRPVLITGGSGFYLKAFFSAVADDVSVAAPVREELGQLPLAQALARLRLLNPAGLGALDVANPRRVARALERCVASGRPLLELQAEFARRPSPFADYQIELTRLHREPADLENRLVARGQAMIAAGLVGEVRGLLPRGLAGNLSAAKAIGYREVLALFAGEIAEADLGPLIIRHTRGLVKKQLTWFRTQLPAHRQISVATLEDDRDLFPR